MKTYLLRLLLAVMAVVTHMPAVNASSILIPTADGQFIDISQAVCNICNLKNGVIENTRIAATFSFSSIVNSTDQFYELSFEASLNKREPATIAISLLDENSNVVHTGTVQTLSTGGWNNFTSYKLYLGKIPAGTYTLLFKVTAVTDNYAGNFKKIAIRTTNEKLPETIPTAAGETFHISNAILGGSASFGHYKEENTTKTYTIQHPSLMHTDADFEFVANKIQANSEPWKSAWNYLKNIKYTKLDNSFTTSAPDHLERNPYQQGQSEGNFKVAREPGLAAYYLGLCWRIAKKLGDPNADKYADKAAKIMDNWTTTCKYVKVEGSHDHYALVVGFDGHRFIQATELIRDYQPWVESGGLDKAKEWLHKNFAEPAKLFISQKSDPYYSWGGWEIPCLNTMLSTGIVRDDQDLINEVVNYFRHGPGSGCIGNLVVAMHKDPAGKGQGYCLGQADESGRDQDHAGLSMVCLAPMCLAAYNIGEDLFDIQANDQYLDKSGTPQYRYPKYASLGNVNLTLAFFEYYAKYNADKNESVDMPFTPWETRNGLQRNVASAGRGHFYPGYEAVYDHYKNVLHLDAPYCKKFAERYRPASSAKPFECDNDFPGIGTLMFYKGNLENENDNATTKGVSPFGADDDHVEASGLVQADYIENMSRGASVMFQINNTKAQPYDLNFSASLKGDANTSSTISFRIKGQQYNKTAKVKVTASDSWENFNEYSCSFPEMPVGIYELTLTIDNLSNTQYAGVFKNFYMTNNTANAINGAVTIADDSSVEFYNLQGIRLSTEPQSGIFIKKQGALVRKMCK